MSVVGFQEYWVAGTRVYIQRDPVDSVEQPFVDLGTIATVAPTITTEKLELFDGDGGRPTKVDEAASRINESYDVTFNNLAPENLALLFLGTAPEAYTQSAAEVVVQHYAHPGRLVKTKDSAGENVYSLTTVGGVYTGTLTTAVLTAIVKSTKTFTLTGDLSAEADLFVGQHIIVHAAGLANILNSRTYTITSATPTFGGGSSTLTVEEEPAADETAITGQVSFENAGTIYDQGADWEVVSLDRGIIRMVDGGAFAADASVQILYSTAALSGNRLIHPQALQGEIRGKATMILSRQGNLLQTAREFNCTITPNGASFTSDDFSNMVLTISVTSDPTNTTAPAGRLLQFKGPLPAKS